MVPFIPVSRPLPLCASVEIFTSPSLRIMRLPLPDLFRLSQTAFLLSGYDSIYLIYVGTEIYINLNNKMKVILKTKSQTLKQHY